MTDKDYTHIAMVVDRSGSMATIAGDMNGAILALLGDQAKQDGYCVVDITTFDDKIERPYVNVRPDDVKGEVIHPRGLTALNDALGKTIVELGERFAAMPDDERPGLVVFVVVTDGYENHSKEYKTDQVKAMIKEQSERWGWQFMYLATNVDAFDTGRDYGFDPGSTINFAASSAGTQNVAGATSNVISKGRSSASRGLKVNTSYSDEDREEAMKR